MTLRTALASLSLLLVAGAAGAQEARPAGAQEVAATKAGKPGDKQMSGMSILGNDDAPKSLVIVPWKSSDLGAGLDVSRALDDGRQPGEHEVEHDGRIGTDHTLHRGVADVALVPQRHVLEGRERIAAHQAREPGHVLAQDRVALVRHRRRALLPLAERLGDLPHLGALQVADLDGEPLQ